MQGLSVTFIKPEWFVLNNNTKWLKLAAIKFIQLFDRLDTIDEHRPAVERLHRTVVVCEGKCRGLLPVPTSILTILISLDMRMDIWTEMRMDMGTDMHVEYRCACRHLSTA